jgi:hypothetical protein
MLTTGLDCAITLVEVSGLFQEESMIEIQGVAVTL